MAEAIPHEEYEPTPEDIEFLQGVMGAIGTDRNSRKRQNIAVTRHAHVNKVPSAGVRYIFMQMYGDAERYGKKPLPQEGDLPPEPSVDQEAWSAAEFTPQATQNVARHQEYMERNMCGRDYASGEEAERLREERLEQQAAREQRMQD